jgi:hypothetical protein
MILKIISSFKNHDFTQIKKQLEQKKSIEAELIQ